MKNLSEIASEEDVGKNLKNDFLSSMLDYIRTIFLAAAMLCLLASCAASSTSKHAPDTYNGLQRKQVYGLGGSVNPRAMCAPGWKRDPDLDSFLTGNTTEEDAARKGLPKASVKYVAYTEPGSENLFIGAWRHRGWWVEPEWEELTVERTDLAFGRAPGAKTLTRLRLRPDGMYAREETDIHYFEWAPYGDKRNIYRDKRIAVLGEGSPADIALLDDGFDELVRIERADPKFVRRLACGYLVKAAQENKWFANVLNHAGQPLIDPFPYSQLRWYAPPPIDEQADRSVSYPTTFLLPVDELNSQGALARPRPDLTPGWPICTSSSTFLSKPDDCLGAYRISGRAWVIWWQTPVGIRLAFSDAGNPDVADLIASKNRAQWIDWKVLWYQLTPHTNKRWILAVAQPSESGTIQWRAFHDAECAKPTFLGLAPRESLEKIERSLVMAEAKAWEDQERIDAEREKARLAREEAERIAAEKLAAQVAEREAEEAAIAANTIWMKDCEACEGKGFLVSTRAITTYYSPIITYHDGYQTATRRSITSTQPHYDGICGVCKGSGWVEAD